MPRLYSLQLLRSVSVAALIGATTATAFAADLWVYSDRDFTGSFARLSRSEGSLPTGAARSLRVANGVWEACTGTNFTGECRRFTTGDYREVGGRYGEAILSVREVTYAQGSIGYAAPKLQLFEGRQYRGRTLTLEQSVSDLRRAGFDDRASSAIVTGGTWELCTEYNYRGRCQALPPGQYHDLGGQLDNRILSVRSLEQPRSAPPAQPAPANADVSPLAGAIVGAIVGSLAQSSSPPAQGVPVQPLNPYDRTRVEIFGSPNFGGVAMTIDGDVANLRGTGLNDAIQSMRVFGGSWEACENKDFGGACMVFGPGDYRRLPPQLDRSISSIRQLSREPNWNGVIDSGATYQLLDANAPRSRHPIWLYEHASFNGATIRAVGDVPNMADSGMNDRASSMFISWGTWQLCEHANYAGRCFTASRPRSVCGNARWHERHYFVVPAHQVTWRHRSDATSPTHSRASDCRCWASAQPDRPSYDVAWAMQRAGFKIFGVNPQYAGESILGQTCVASLAEVTHPIDIVNCFRRSEAIVEVATAAVKRVPLPKLLWMQQGIANPAARAIAEAAGIEVVENSCIKIAFLSQR